MIRVKTLVLLSYYAFVLSSYLFEPEIALFWALIGCLIGSNFQLWKVNVKDLKAPIFLLIIGLLFAFKNPLNLVVKDIYYFAIPIIIYSFGQIAGKFIDFREFVFHNVVIGILLGLLFLGNLTDLSTTESISQIKDEQGLPSYAIVLAFCLIIISLKYDLLLKARWFYNISALLLLFVMAMSFSRTFILLAFVMTIIGIGVLRFNKYFIIKVVSVLFLFSVTFILITNQGISDRKTFIGKLSTSFDEMTISNYSNKKEISNNWRGFEAFKGIEQVKRGTTIELFLGQGFGQTAPLGFYMPLGNSTFNEIPKFHNGYITLLLKTGIVGLCIYLIFFFKITLNSMRVAPLKNEYVAESNLIAAISISILLTTLVISGWLNKGSFLIFVFSLGFLLERKRNRELTS